MARFWKLTLAISFLIFEVACSLASLDGTTARITAITLAPENATVASGTIQRFSAIATFNDGTTQDVTDEVEWGASAEARGLITMVTGVKGGVRAVQVGAEAVTAVATNGVTGVASLTVTPATLIRVVVNGDYDPAFRALTKSFTATGIFSDGSTQDITADATWSVSDTNIAVSGGVANGEFSTSLISPGVATVTARYLGVEGESEIVVANATLVSIDVEPPEGFTSLPAGYFVPLTATGNYSDGTAMDLTSAVTWSSADDAIATVSNDAGYYGRVTGVSAGTIAITATIDGVSDNLSVSISAATLASISLSQSSVTTYKALKTELTATGTFSDASTLDITKNVTWSSANSTVATVSINAETRGEVTAVGQGTTTVTATSGLLSANATFLVLHYEITGITITLGSSTLPEGFPQPATAIATFSDGSTFDVSDQVTWASSNGVAVIADPTDPGTLIGGEIDPSYSNKGDVTAALGGVTSLPAPVAIVEATLESISISPAAPSVSVGGTTGLTATGNFSNSTTLPLTRFVKWTSSARTYATVKNSPKAQKGNVNGIALGESTISAKWNSSIPHINGTATITVEGAPGSLDISFGNNGQEIVLNSNVVSESTTSPNTATDPSYPNSAMQSDDKFVVADSFWTGSRYQLQLVRYNADGTPDEAFDGDSGDANGFVRIDVGSSNAYGRAVALQPDGKILVAGMANQSATGTPVAFVARFTSTGALDTGFDGLGGSVDGLVTYLPDGTAESYAGLGNGIILFGIEGRTQAGASVVRLSSGKIIVAGGSDAVGWVAQLSSTGNFDTTFATNGLFEMVSSGTIFYDMVVRPNGKIVVGGGGALNASSGGILVQLNSNGTIDTDFDGNNGWNGQITLGPTYPACFNWVESILLQSDGKLILGGANAWHGDLTNWLAPSLLRLNTDGSTDLTFMSEGSELEGYAVNHPDALPGCVIFSSAPPGNSLGLRGSFSSLAIQSDGKILGQVVMHSTVNVGGGVYAYPGTGLYLTRFTDAGLDTTFGDDGIYITGINADRFGGLFTQSTGRIVSLGKSSGLFHFLRFWD